ncbi:MAG: hypothetical protein MUF23_05745 [Pirellula sp.]|nr:hypothetical protein [Pirellula sp.]
MAGNEHKRQKALAKKRNREKEIRKAKNAASNQSTRDYVLQLARGAWHACFESGQFGMHHLICVRRTRAGFGASVFLIDELCLGVKDADVIRDVSMESLRDSILERGGSEVSPAYALKKLQAVIEWSRGIGFEPHPKTPLAMQIFRDVDPNDCSSTFSFGRPEDGKPMFMAGPFDGPERIQATLQKLQKLGQGNYHFVFGDPTTSSTGAFQGNFLQLADDDQDADEHDDDDQESVENDLIHLESIDQQSNPL